MEALRSEKNDLKSKLKDMCQNKKKLMMELGVRRNMIDTYVIKNEDLRSENLSLKDNISCNEQIIKDMEEDIISTSSKMKTIKSKSMAFWF